MVPSIGHHCWILAAHPAVVPVRPGPKWHAWRRSWSCSLALPCGPGVVHDPPIITSNHQKGNYWFFVIFWGTSIYFKSVVGVLVRVLWAFLENALGLVLFRKQICAPVLEQTNACFKLNTRTLRASFIIVQHMRFLLQKWIESSRKDLESFRIPLVGKHFLPTFPIVKTSASVKSRHVFVTHFASHSQRNQLLNSCVKMPATIGFLPSQCGSSTWRQLRRYSATVLFWGNLAWGWSADRW